MSPRLLIPRAALSAMFTQAAAERPLECCGLLAGPPADGATELRVERCYPLVNAAGAEPQGPGAQLLRRVGSAFHHFAAIRTTGTARLVADCDRLPGSRVGGG